METLPWLEYDGETTAELLACGETHRVDSLVVAFEEAIMGKDEDAITPEERVVLAVEALEREVNHGGYVYFFDTASEFTPIIVEALHAIGASTAAALTAEAIRAAQGDDALLEDCDQRYLDEVGDLSEELFAFIRAHAAQIQI